MLLDVVLGKISFFLEGFGTREVTEEQVVFIPSEGISISNFAGDPTLLQMFLGVSIDFYPLEARWTLVAFFN